MHVNYIKSTLCEINIFIVLYYTQFKEQINKALEKIEKSNFDISEVKSGLIPSLNAHLTKTTAKVN